MDRALLIPRELDRLLQEIFKNNSGESRLDGPIADARSLYDKLEQVILPFYYRNPDQFVRVMRAALFVLTERMISQYVTKAYVKRSGRYAGRA